VHLGLAAELLLEVRAASVQRAVSGQDGESSPNLACAPASIALRKYIRHGKPELEGEIRGGTTGAPRDVHEQRLELRHTLDALIKVLDACTQEETSDQRRCLQN